MGVVCKAYQTLHDMPYPSLVCWRRQTEQRIENVPAVSYTHLHHTSVRKHVQTKYFPQPATGSTAHRIYRRIARQTRYRTQTTARTLSGAIDHQPQQGYRRTNPATPTRMGHKQQPEKSDDFTQQPITNS